MGLAGGRPPNPCRRPAVRSHTRCGPAASPTHVPGYSSRNPTRSPTPLCTSAPGRRVRHRRTPARGRRVQHRVVPQAAQLAPAIVGRPIGGRRFGQSAKPPTTSCAPGRVGRRPTPVWNPASNASRRVTAGGLRCCGGCAERAVLPPGGCPAGTDGHARHHDATGDYAPRSRHHTRPRTHSGPAARQPRARSARATSALARSAAAASSGSMVRLRATRSPSGTVNAPYYAPFDARRSSIPHVSPTAAVP